MASTIKRLWILEVLVSYASSELYSIDEVDQTNGWDPHVFDDLEEVKYDIVDIKDRTTVIQVYLTYRKLPSIELALS